MTECKNDVRPVEGSKIREFMKKLKDLEKEYSVELITDDPYDNFLVKDYEVRKVFYIDGEEY